MSSPAVVRAARLLRALAEHGPQPATALARDLGVPRSSAYVLLAALEEEGLVVHLPDEQRWALGATAFELGSAYLRHGPLERAARPLLGRLARRWRQPAHLGVLHGEELLYLLKEAPRGGVRVVTAVGVRLPAHLTASGRALLAHLPEAQVRAALRPGVPLVSRTGRGPGDATALLRLLAEERRAGWSHEDGHVSEGVESVASVVLDHVDHPVAALSVAFPSAGLPAEEVAASVRDVAAVLAHRLGGRVPAKTGGGAPSGPSVVPP